MRWRRSASVTGPGPLVDRARRRSCSGALAESAAGPVRRPRPGRYGSPGRAAGRFPAAASRPQPRERAAAFRPGDRATSRCRGTTTRDLPRIARPGSPSPPPPPAIAGHLRPCTTALLCAMSPTGATAQSSCPRAAGLPHVRAEPERAGRDHGSIDRDDHPRAGLLRAPLRTRMRTRTGRPVPGRAAR